MKGRRWKRPPKRQTGYAFHPDQYVIFSPAELEALEKRNQENVATIAEALKSALAKVERKEVR